MKLLSLSLCLSLFLLSPLMGQSKKALQAEVQRLNAQIEELKKPKEVDLEGRHARASYAIGVMMANTVKSQGMDSLNLDALSSAFRDVLGGQALKMQRSEAEKTIQNYMQEMMDAKKTKSIEEQADFLKRNKAQEGVQETASGLQYKVIKEGSGKKPGPTDRVTVHYTGMLSDGSIFDSSVERGEPATFGVSQVITGWTEALQLMKEGDKWTIYIPYALGYGERGAGRDIPPYATLIFDVELLKVN